MSVYKEFQSVTTRNIMDAVIERRVQLDWTQADLARHAGKCLAFIQSMERGRNSPSLKNLEPVLEALDLTLKVERCC